MTAHLNAVQSNNILTDNFDDLSNWTDMSKAIGWGNVTTPDSAFTTANDIDTGQAGIVRFNRTIPRSFVGYGSDDLNMYQCLDIQFDSPVDHTRSILVIEFRARWEKPDVGGQDGEGNRFIVSVNHDYPDGGILLLGEQFDGDQDVAQSRVNDPSDAWYARPAYQIRIRGGTEGSQAEPILMYGGGLELEGEYEFGGNNFWLPGFVASVSWAYLNGSPNAVGIVPPGMEYGNSAGGIQSNGVYPWTTYDIIDGGIASANWQRFLYIIYPDRQEVWRNKFDSDDVADYVLEMVMPLPEQDELEPNAPLYRYFPELEGVRLFWRVADDRNPITPGAYADNVYVDWLTIDETVYDSNYQFWASEYFTNAVVADDLQEADTWGMDANPDGDPFPNSVDRYLNQSPTVRQEMVFEEADLIVEDYFLYANDNFAEFPVSLFEFYPLPPADPNEPSVPGYWGKQANNDGDFYTHGAEQLLGLDPLLADPDPADGLTIKLDREDNVLAAIYKVDSTTQGMTGELQISTDGVDWSVPPGTEHFRAWNTDGSWSVVTKMPTPENFDRLFVRFWVEETLLN